MPDWKKIRKDWEGGDITLPQLSERYGVKLGTIKSRKSREGWGTEKDATATIQKGATSPTDATEDEPILEAEGLTEKQKKFCLYYIKSFNATQAALKAGYAPSSAHVRGHELVRNSKIAAEIRRLKGNTEQSLFVDAMDLVRKHIAIAFADIADFVEFRKVTEPLLHEETGEPLFYENGEPKTRTYNVVDFKDSEMVDGTIINEVKQGREGVSIKLADRSKSMDFLAKYFDILPDDFKRQLEIEKLKLARERLHGVTDPEEYEDDGFLDALNGKTKDVWADGQ